MDEVETIQYNSIPDLDAWFPDTFWSCEQWITWHKLNVKESGQDIANSKFIYWWDEQDTFAGPYNKCKYNSDFYLYFKDQGIDTGWLLSKVFVGIDLLADGIPDLGKGLKTTFQWSKYILPIALIGFGLAYTYRNLKRK
tara:strand:+ start:1201 stop:1617 length:417 start_codon:yes stop_codon:yes gene_type:complete